MRNTKEKTTFMLLRVLRVFLWCLIAVAALSGVDNNSGMPCYCNKFLQNGEIFKTMYLLVAFIRTQCCIYYIGHGLDIAGHELDIS